MGVMVIVTAHLAHWSLCQQTWDPSGYAVLFCSIDGETVAPACEPLFGCHVTVSAPWEVLSEMSAPTFFPLMSRVGFFFFFQGWILMYEKGNVFWKKLCCRGNSLRMGVGFISHVLAGIVCVSYTSSFSPTLRVSWLVRKILQKREFHWVFLLFVKYITIQLFLLNLFFFF